MQKRIFKLLLLMNIISFIAAGAMQRWTLEILESTTYSSDPNIMELDGEVVRVSRGLYGFNGLWNLKVDLNDDTLFFVTAERSQNRDGPYSKMPMGVDNQTLSSAMNKFYKDNIQQIVQKCCENAPVVEDTFIPPLTPRIVKATKCVIETDNLPNIMMEGYYRVRLAMLGPNDFLAYAESLYFIENKKF